MTFDPSFVFVGMIVLVAVGGLAALIYSLARWRTEIREIERCYRDSIAECKTYDCKPKGKHV